MQELFPAKELRGWSRYTSNLIRELSFLDLEIYLFSDRPLNQDLLKGSQADNIKTVVQKGSSYFRWEQGSSSTTLQRPQNRYSPLPD